jgi:hypothetical protein
MRRSAELTPRGASARELGERLNAHVRFEERELFPMLGAGSPRSAPSWAETQRSPRPVVPAAGSAMGS